MLRRLCRALCTFRREFLAIPPDRPYVNAGRHADQSPPMARRRLPQRLGRFIEAHGNSLWYWDQDAINANLYAPILPLPTGGCAGAGLKSKWRDIALRRAASAKPARRPRSFTTAQRKSLALPRHREEETALFRLSAKTDWRSANPLGLAWYHMPEFLPRSLAIALGRGLHADCARPTKTSPNATQGFGGVKRLGRFWARARRATCAACETDGH